MVRAVLLLLRGGGGCECGGNERRRKADTAVMVMSGPRISMEREVSRAAAMRMRWQDSEEGNRSSGPGRASAGPSTGQADNQANEARRQQQQQAWRRRGQGCAARCGGEGAFFTRAHAAACRAQRRWRFRRSVARSGPARGGATASAPVHSTQIVASVSSAQISLSGKPAVIAEMQRLGHHQRLVDRGHGARIGQRRRCAHRPARASAGAG